MTNRIGQSPSNSWGLVGTANDRARLQGNIANIPNPAAQNRALEAQNQPVAVQNNDARMANQGGITR